MRLIDADALKKSVEGLTDCYNGFSDTYDKACIIGLIDEEPTVAEQKTVDAVPVVRCKDCRKNPKISMVGCPMACLKTWTEDGFCFQGEKVTE